METPQYVLDGNRIVEQPYQTNSDHHSFLKLIDELRDSGSGEQMAVTIERIKNKMAYTDKEAEAFLFFTVDTYNEIIESRNSLTNYLMCSDASIELAAGKKANLQVALDDLVDADLKKHFQRVEESLDNQAKTNLHLWLSGIGTGAGDLQVKGNSVTHYTSGSCNQLAFAEH